MIIVLPGQLLPRVRREGEDNETGWRACHKLSAGFLVSAHLSKL
jgi:hypothetical protein